MAMMSFCACENHDFEPLPVQDKGETSTPPSEGGVTVDPDALYNGIKLPAQWPAKRNYATQIRKGMTPSEFWSQPEIVYATVGRQLFVDNFVVKSTTMRQNLFSVQNPKSLYPIFNSSVIQYLKP